MSGPLLILAGFVALLVGLGFYILDKRKKEQLLREVRAQQANRIAMCREQYRLALTEFAQQEYITDEGAKVLFALANNFFVFQGVNDDNLVKLENFTNELVEAVCFVIGEDKTVALSEAHKAILQSFIDKLPETAKECNQDFFDNLLPALLKELYEAEPPAEPEPGYHQTEPVVVNKDEPVWSEDSEPPADKPD